MACRRRVKPARPVRARRRPPAHLMAMRVVSSSRFFLLRPLSQERPEEPVSPPKVSASRRSGRRPACAPRSSSSAARRARETRFMVERFGRLMAVCAGRGVRARRVERGAGISRGGWRATGDLWGDAGARHLRGRGCRTLIAWCRRTAEKRPQTSRINTRSTPRLSPQRPPLSPPAAELPPSPSRPHRRAANSPGPASIRKNALQDACGPAGRSAAAGAGVRRAPPRAGGWCGCRRRAARWAFLPATS